MEAKTLSFIDRLDQEEIIKHGVKLHDQLEIIPTSGHKKIIELMRTEYRISSSKSNDIRVEGTNLFMPILGSDTFSMTITLVPCLSTKALETHGRYLLKTEGPFPFKINGTFAREAFLSRGDEIVIGMSRLHFQDGKEKNESENFLEELEALGGSVIQSTLPICIEGETGTGKSYLAKKIHERSGALGSFVHLNLSSFSAGLLESELFGHKKGAFTGACYEKMGAILEASHGTLFLDEIDSLPIETQTKLLLFLDDMTFRAVGGGKSQKVQTRLIVASGQSLLSQVESGKMRRDFYYRITSGVVVSLKPLRSSPEKVEQLLTSFEIEHNLVSTAAVRDFYKKQNWPGNIRQFLSHLNKKKTVMKGRRLELSAIDEQLTSFDENLSTNQTTLPFEEMKKKYVEMIFFRCKKNVSATAKNLQLSKNTVRGILKVAL